MSPPPRDPSGNHEAFDFRRETGAFRVVEREYTPVEDFPLPPPSNRERKVASTSFIVALSVILGIIIAASAIIGGLGKAFFVTREEHNNQTTAYGNDKSDIQKSLMKLEGHLSSQNATLEKQGQSIERLIDKIQTVREDMARRGR